MASGGGAAAYQKLERLDNQISDNANKAADRAAANQRAKAKANDERRAKETERKNAEADKNKEKAKERKQSTSNTGRQSYDATVNRVGNALFKEGLEMEAEALRLDELGTDESKAKATQMRIAFDVKNREWNQMIEGDERMRVNIKALKEAQAQGKITDAETEALIKSYDRDDGVNIEYVEGKGFIRTTPMYEAENGEPILDEEGNQKYQDLEYNKVLNDDYKAYWLEDENTMADGIMVDMGVAKVGEEDGQFIRTQKGYSNQALEQLEGRITQIVGSDTQKPNNEEMYKWNHAIGSGESRDKKKDFTPEERDAVANAIRTKIMGRESIEDTSKVRTQTPDEKKKIADDKIAVQNRNAKTAEERLAWAKDPKNPANIAKKKNTAIGKKGSLTPEIETQLADVMRIALEISKVDNEEDVQAILNDSKIGDAYGAAFDWGGLAGTQFDIGDLTGTTPDSILKNAKAIGTFIGIPSENTNVAQFYMDLLNNNGNIPQEEEAPAQDGKTTNTEPIKGTSGTTYK